MASIEGYEGENIIVRDLDEVNGCIFLEIGSFEGWVRVQYKIVPDGTYNQSVLDIDLPYIVVRNNVYSLSDFKIWDLG